MTHIVVAGTTHWRRRTVDGYWMASCPDLKILVWGESDEELVARQRTAMVMAVLHPHSHGILESFLGDRGLSVTETEASIERPAIKARPPRHFPARSGLGSS